MPTAATAARRLLQLTIELAGTIELD